MNYSIYFQRDLTIIWANISIVHQHRPRTYLIGHYIIWMAFEKKMKKLLDLVIFLSPKYYL